MKLRLYLVGLIPLLGACSPASLHSDNPLFLFADSSSPLRPGVWVWNDPECAIDPAAPVAQWPDCASIVRVGNRKMADGEGSAQAYLIAPGLPRILQIRGEEGGYSYEALLPSAYDDRGLVVAARRVGVPCPEEERETLAIGENADPDAEPDDRCLTDFAGQVIAMAQTTLDDDMTPNFSWVRAGRPDDFKRDDD